MKSLQLCLTRGDAEKVKHCFVTCAKYTSLCNETTGYCTYAHTAENGHTCHNIRLINADGIAEADIELSRLLPVAEVHRLTCELILINSASEKNKWVILY
jgi:hypothetical protein